MKYLKSILEFNRKDRNLLLSSGINELFTVAFEFELECDDPKYITKDELSTYMKDIKKRLIDDSKKNGVYDENVINYLIELIDLTDLEYTFNMLEKPSVVRNINKELLSILFKLLDDYEDIEIEESDTNLDYGIEMIAKHLPNFYKKWKDELKFNFDQTLNRGIEFSPKKYVISLDTAIQMINDFYDDFEKQNYWYQDDTTSIHINLGFTRPVKWNITKGLIMLGEIDKRSVPFVYQGIESRIETNYTRSLLKDIDKLLKKKIQKSGIRDLKVIEKEIEKMIGNSIKKFGAKAFSVNIERIKNDNYVEFRHIGGKVDRKLVIDKLMYLSYISYLMTTNYKQQDYYKKLYKYIFD
ncbi:MAG: hypothetical protein HPY57_15690 [Ignavibacteria bacterium]|nr:hypothetical protein [Ignavibacteria bacterium]